MFSYNNVILNKTTQIFLKICMYGLRVESFLDVREVQVGSSLKNKLCSREQCKSYNILSFRMREEG